MANPSWENRKPLDVLAFVYIELVEIFQASLLNPVENDLATSMRIKDLTEKIKEYGNNYDK